MPGADAELRRRELALERWERRVAARERELYARRSWRRAWWALRLAPWSAVELVVAGGLILAAFGLVGAGLAAAAVLAGVMIAALALGRLFGDAPGPPAR